MRRGGRGLLPGVCAGAAVAGWFVVSGVVSGAVSFWSLFWPLFWPGTVLDHLLLPGVVLVGAAVLRRWVQTRWLMVGAALFASSWLAGAGVMAAGVARPEFWRVWFAAGAVCWWMGRSGAEEGRRGLAVALSLVGGLVVGEAGSAWVAAGLVLAGAVAGTGLVGGGVAGAGKGGKGVAGAGLAVVPALLLSMGIVAADLGAGRSVRGRVGVMDLVCVGALGAPLVVVAVERRLGRMRRLAPLVVALGVTFLGWVADRVVRSY